MTLPTNIHLANCWVFTLVSVGCTLTGRSLLALAAPRYARCRLEDWLLSAFCGTSLWMLVLGSLCHSGFTIAQIRLPVGALFLLIFLAAVGMHRSAFFLRLPSLASLFLIYILGNLMCLLLWERFQNGGWYPIFNDASIYANCSTWLQYHAFSRAVDPFAPHNPMSQSIEEFQECGYRMGGTFFLAFVSSWFPRNDTFEVLKPVALWCLVLNFAGIYLLARWGIRLNRCGAALAAAIAHALPNPLYLAEEYNFMPQLLGTSLLMVSLAVLNRTRVPSRWNFQSAVVIALLVAGVISVYSEFAPILAVVAFCHLLLLGTLAYRKQEGAKLSRFFAVTILLLLVLGNYEWIRAVRAQFNLVQVAVGFEINWSRNQWLNFISGVDWNDPEFANVIPIEVTWIVLFLMVLGLVGSLKNSFSTVLMATLTFAGLALYFALIAIDPSTGLIGHRWSCFKIVKWSFPLLCVLTANGLSLIGYSLNLKYRRWAGWLAILALASVNLQHTFPQVARIMKKQSDLMCRHLGVPQPRLFFGDAKTKIRNSKASSVYLVRAPKDHWPHSFVPYLCWPKPMANAWPGSNFLGSNLNHDYLQESPGEIGSHTLYLMWFPPSFTADFDVIAGNLVKLRKVQPYFFDLAFGSSKDSDQLTGNLFVPVAGKFNCEFRIRGGEEGELQHFRIEIFAKAPTSVSNLKPIRTCDVEFEGKLGRCNIQVEQGIWDARVTSFSSSKRRVQNFKELEIVWNPTNEQTGEIVPPVH
ncbi:hypothetical protein KIH39_05555 [Telmatocola sphagniphila]|uniref:Uncharacterized protein n=1 Tax=Telmatocola sphagniphila TaxID=1123043 RepID=A0A8E6BAG7_9BACT|nr:hypothetical protein [Telmatocola sphagniphila]QVL33380.1 hypothetical protein KIH39_05555 [Telmatocola sphagniphila]